MPISKLSVKARWMLLLCALLHLALSARIGLSTDEAHYLLYARHLDWSYFDHPPLVGWVQWPLVSLGAPVVVLRLLPGLCWLLTGWGVYQLTLRWARALAWDSAAQVRAADAALAAWCLAVMPHVLGLGLLPDSLLMPLQLALLWQTWTLLEYPSAELHRWRPWLLLGLLLGLSGLAKYTAAFAVLPLVVLLLWRHGWALLRLPPLWGGMALAGGCILPVLGWNAANDWASFRYQLAHGQGSAWHGVEVLRFLVLQMVVYGPLLALSGLGVWVSRVAVLDSGDGKRLPLAALASLALLPWLVLAYMAGGGSSLPHWTAPSWALLAVPAGIALAQLQHGLQRWLVWALGWVQGIALAGAVVAMVWAGAPWLQRQAQWPERDYNPLADLYGWDKAGQIASALARQEGITSVTVQNWTLASRIAWYAAPLPVHVLAPGRSQFDWWSPPLAERDRTLVVDWSQMAYELPLRFSNETVHSGEPGGFTSCQLLGQWAVPDPAPAWVHHGAAPLSQFRFWACKGWQGEPLPRLTLPAVPASADAPH